MKVLFCLPRQHPNQAGWYHALQNAGHEVEYIVSYTLPSNERSDLPTPTIANRTLSPLWYKVALHIYTILKRSSAQKPYVLWPDRTSLEKEIVRFSPDVIIIREVLTPLSLITQSIARKHSIRTIHYSQAPLRKKDGLLLRALRLMYVIPKYRMTPTLAPGTSEIGQKDTFYVPLFVAPSTSRIEESDSGAVRILFVGKYNGRRKKHLLLLKAIAKMPKTCPVKLTMVGSTVFPDDVYHQEIIERIKDLNLEKQVILKYDVDPMEMASLYRNHDVLVLPSVDEPFSISPLEAMAHGLPVIVTDTNGCQFHIREGVNGYVIKSNDINSLLNALKNITAMSNLKQMKRGAFCYVSDENNEPAFIKYFEQMIHQLR